MSIRIALIVAVAGCAGFFLGAKVKEEDIAKELLWETYTNSAQSLKHHSFILENLRLGEEEKAISHLEHLLNFDEAIVTGCVNDLCKDTSDELFDEALQLSEEYREQYMPGKGSE